MSGSKDDRLAAVAATHNVARFVSFSPGRPTVRHLLLDARDPGRRDAATTIEDAVRRLLDLAPDQTVNVRSFRPTQELGNPFERGLGTVDAVVGTVRRLAADGYTTIVNEDIGVDDGGVSGVADGDVVEFSPYDTPRGVERPGHVTASREVALQVLGTVYGVVPDLVGLADRRVEWSIHLRRHGHRGEPRLVWEVGAGGALSGAAPRWPNRWSRLLGDKVFGLLLADAVGLLVPRVQVVVRDPALLFSFGQRTGTGEVWTRSAPAEPLPGLLRTVPGHVDMFRFMREEDAVHGDVTRALLQQDAVSSQWSGAARRSPDGAAVVEGVRGAGARFMTGDDGPDDAMPDQVRQDVTHLLRDATSALGATDLEWAHDGSRCWLLQIHQGHDQANGSAERGEPARWLTWRASEGLSRLRDVLTASGADAGVEVVGHVGLTSHAGTLLRRSGLPWRQVPSARP